MKDEEKDTHTPIHTHIKSDPISTPGYWRLFTTWIMMRYGTREVVGLIKKKKHEDHSFKDTNKTDFVKIQEAFRTGREDTDPYVVSQLKELEAQSTKPFNGKSSLGSERIAEVKQAYATMREIDQGHSHDVRAYKRANQIINDFEGDIERGLKKESEIKVKDLDFKADRWGDRINGGITLLGTGIYAARVASDIKSVFAETVAYEHDKKPDDVGWKDLIQSDNKLVDKAIKNYVKYNSLRVASDAVFFMRDIAGIKIGKYGLSNVGGLNLTKINGTDLGMAVKGAMLSKDILTKQTTFFEDTIRLIDTKLNPIRGLGEQVSASDVTDLYQKYAMDHKREAAFRRLDYTDVGDSISWRHAEPIFDRIAELMNHTYHYKNPMGAKNENADFPLPKYLYLLGHDLVDLSKPKETLALIEVASCHGMKAVKEVASAFKRGISVEACLEKYPVDMTVLNELDTLSKKPLTHAQRALAAGSTPAQSMVERVTTQETGVQRTI